MGSLAAASLECISLVALMPSLLCLALWISGCVYLPLDPSYPSSRLRFLLDRAGAVAVVSDGSDSGLYGSHRICIPSPSQLPTEPEALESDVSIFSSVKVEPLRLEDCAYILFTSGSTGEPKGVMVTHENMTLMIDWTVQVLSVTSLDSSATVTSLSFDPCLQEILVPLSVGGTVHVIPHALALGDLTRQVSYVAATPTVANELLRAGLLPPLKVLMVGGEVLATGCGSAVFVLGSYWAVAQLLWTHRVHGLRNSGGGDSPSSRGYSDWASSAQC